LRRNLLSKYSIWLLLLLNLTIVILLLFMISWRYWWTGKLFSAEVNAAFINGAFTFITVTATLGITAYFNYQTQKVAIQSSRSGLRDLLYQKRLEIYPEIKEYMGNILYFYFLAKKKRYDLNTWKNIYWDNYHPIVRYITEESYYLSPRVKEALMNFWIHISMVNSENPIFIVDDEFTMRAKELSTVVELYMNADLTLDEIETDFSNIQAHARVYMKRLKDDAFTYDIVKDKKKEENLLKEDYTAY
jgi:hypothetical protein